MTDNEKLDALIELTENQNSLLEEIAAALQSDNKTEKLLEKILEELKTIRHNGIG